MAAREVLGHMPCPDCGFSGAEIKRQKCGVKLYRFCPECNAQFFARTEKQGAAMAKIIAPTAVSPSVTVTEPEPKKAPPVAAPPVTVKEPKKAAPPPAKATPPEQIPAEKKAAPGSFSDVLKMLTGGN